MPVRTIQIDIIENNLILEVQLEETIQAKTIISRLKHEGHLNLAVNYFVKTANGTPINDTTPVKSFPENIVITENEKWMQIFSDSFDDEYVTEISNGVALHNNIYWFFPLFANFSWGEANMRCHLFEITAVKLVNGDFLTAYALVQYDVIDEILFGSQDIHEYHSKMEQIITDTLKIEFAAYNLVTGDFFNEMHTIEQKAQEYVTAHTELKWNAKINALTILGLNHNKGKGL